MDCYKYKNIHSLFPDKVLRQVEAHEQMGWSLYFLQSSQIFWLGCGGGGGLHAVMRRKISEKPHAEEK